MQKFIRNYVETDSIPVYSDINLRNSSKIINVPAPMGATDVATKAYVDAVGFATFMGDPTGVVDVTTDLQTSLNGLADGNVLKMPPGTFRITGSISIPKGVGLSGSVPLRSTTNHNNFSSESIGTVVSCEAAAVFLLSDYSSVSGIQFLGTQSLSSVTVNDSISCINIASVDGCNVSNCSFSLLSHCIKITNSKGVYLSYLSGFGWDTFIETEDSDIYLSFANVSPDTYTGSRTSNLFLNNSFTCIEAIGSDINLTNSLIDNGAINLLNCNTKVSNSNVDTNVEVNGTCLLQVSNSVFSGSGDCMRLSANSNTILLSNVAFYDYDNFILNYLVANIGLLDASTLRIPSTATFTNTAFSLPPVVSQPTITYSDLLNIASVTTSNVFMENSGGQIRLRLKARASSTTIGVRANFSITLPSKVVNITNQDLFLTGFASFEDSTQIKSIENLVIVPELGTLNIQVYYTLPNVTGDVYISVDCSYPI